MARIEPQPRQAAFLACEADIALFGGAAGGGKTYAGLLSLAYGHHLPGYDAIAFRRTSPELEGGGSLWAESQPLYRSLGGEPRASPNRRWLFPSGATIELRHLQHVDDVYSHQGKQYAQIFFDELTHFEEEQFWYLMSRARSTSGVRPMVRATCNPDPDSWVRKLIAWWIDDATGYAIPERDGVTRWFSRQSDGRLDWADTEQELAERYPDRAAKSLTFFQSKLEDNPILMARDPGYRGNLESLAAHQRARLLDANWNARAAAGEVFRREWFAVIDDLPHHRIRRTVRAWDKAATEATGHSDPDWTRGALVALCDNNDLVIKDVASIRGRPAAVQSLIRQCAQSDPEGTTIALWQDPGQAGVVDVDVMRSELMGYHVKVHRAATSKVVNAEVWSALAERGSVKLMRGPWNEEFFYEAQAFPDGKHDDMVDAVSLAVMELGLRPTAHEPIVKPADFFARPAYDGGTSTSLLRQSGYRRTRG